MVQPSCEEKHLGLRCEGPVRPALRHGDEGKLRQVLLNLLANAVKFTATGRIILRAEPGPGDSWQFSVEDTGIGIPPEALPKSSIPSNKAREPADTEAPVSAWPSPNVRSN